MQQLAELTKMAILSVDEHRELFAKVGYAEVQMSEEYDKGWICATGTKPSSFAEGFRAADASPRETTAPFDMISDCKPAALKTGTNPA
jgi:hypothetical protein